MGAAAVAVHQAVLACLLAAAFGLPAARAMLPGMPLPAQCTGPARAPVPRSDLNWPANQTRLAEKLHNIDQSKVSLGHDLVQTINPDWHLSV